MERKHMRLGAAALFCALLVTTFLMNYGVTFGESGDMENPDSTSQQALELETENPSSQDLDSLPSFAKPSEQESGEDAENGDEALEEAESLDEDEAFDEIIELEEDEQADPTAEESLALINAGQFMAELNAYFEKTLLDPQLIEILRTELSVLPAFDIANLHDSLTGDKLALTGFVDAARQKLPVAQGEPSGEDLLKLHAMPLSAGSYEFLASSSVALEVNHDSRLGQSNLITYELPNAATQTVTIFDEEYNKYKITATFKFWNPTNVDLCLASASFADIPSEAFSFLGNPAYDAGGVKVAFSGQELAQTSSLASTGYTVSMDETGRMSLRISSKDASLRAPSQTYSTLAFTYWLEGNLELYPDGLPIAEVSSPELSVEFAEPQGYVSSFARFEFPKPSMVALPASPRAHGLRNQAFLADTLAQNAVDPTIAVKAAVQIPKDAPIEPDPVFPPSWTDFAKLCERGEYSLELLIDGYDYARYSGFNQDGEFLEEANLTALSQTRGDLWEIALPLRYAMRHALIDGAFVQAYDFSGGGWVVSPIAEEQAGSLRIFRKGSLLSESRFKIDLVKAAFAVTVSTDAGPEMAEGAFDISISSSYEGGQVSSIHFAAFLDDSNLSSSAYVPVENSSAAYANGAYQGPFFEVSAALPYGYTITGHGKADFSEMVELLAQANAADDFGSYEALVGQARQVSVKTAALEIKKIPKPWFRAWSLFGTGWSN
jgi:hypothetical protein